MSEITVLLEVEYTRSKSDNPDYGYMIDINVIRAEEIDEAIYVYQQDLQGDSEFYSVATADQLVSIPKDGPAVGSTFFRKKDIRVYCATAKEILEAEEDIKLSTQKLINDWQLVQEDILKSYSEIYQYDET